MRLFILFSFSLLISVYSFAQDPAPSCGPGRTLWTSVDETSGNWTSSSTWTQAGAPGTSNVLNVCIFIQGTVTREGDLDFNNGASLTVRSNDTLIVKGNLSFNNNATLEIRAGGVLLVTGDFESENNLTIGSGGKLIILGSASSGNGTTFNDNGGDAYVFGVNNFQCTGSCTGFDPDEDIGDVNDFINNEDQALIDFVNSIAPGTLPITLGSISHQVTSHSIIIHFTTTKEENFSHFEIQRSRDGRSWEVIGEVKGHGNTTEIQAYAFEDRLPLAGLSYYRLNAIDIDGTQEYHGMLSVLFNPGDQSINIYPNPVTSGRFSLQASFELREGAKIRVLDMVGAEILRQEYDGFANEFILPARVKGGLYVVLISQDGITYQKKLLVK